MDATDPDRQVRDRLKQVESLLNEAEKSKDPESRARTKAIVQALMDFHGVGLERILERIATQGESGVALIEAMAQDELVASLLLLYGLHPLDLDSRVQLALEKTRPYLHSHGGNVELLSVAEGIVRLRLHGSCHGCPSSAQTLKQTIEEAIFEMAPDVMAVEVEGEIKNTAEIEPAVSGRLALPILA